MALFWAVVTVGYISWIGSPSPLQANGGSKATPEDLAVISTLRAAVLNSGTPSTLDENTIDRETKLVVTRWIAKTHFDLPYANEDQRLGGVLYASTLIADLDALKWDDATDDGGTGDDGDSGDGDTGDDNTGSGPPDDDDDDSGPGDGSGNGDTGGGDPGTDPGTDPGQLGTWLVRQGQATRPDGSIVHFGPHNPIHYLWGVTKSNSAPIKNIPRQITPGSELVLEDGDYGFLVLYYKSSGSDPITTIRARNPGKVRFLKNPSGGSKTFYGERVEAVRFEGIRFEGDDTAAWMTPLPSSGLTGPDIFFVNCSIEGGWNAETAVGPNNKWGGLFNATGKTNIGHTWNGKKYGFAIIGGHVEGIKREHGIGYFHNLWGNHLIKDVSCKWTGRTGVQVVNRVNEWQSGKYPIPSPDKVGQGDFDIVNCRFEDNCLEDGGGGSVITFRGNLNGNVSIKDTTVLLGANKNLHPSVSKNITGAVVMDIGDGAQQTGTKSLLIEGCHFQVGPHYVGVSKARRGNVNVRNVESFTLRDTAVWQANGAREALDIGFATIGTMTLDKNCDIRGNVKMGGQEWKDVDQDGDGWGDGVAWASFIKEVQQNVDTNGDGVLFSSTANTVVIE